MADRTSTSDPAELPPFQLEAIRSSDLHADELKSVYELSQMPATELFREQLDTPMARIARGLEPTASQHRLADIIQGTLRSPSMLRLSEEMERLQAGMRPLRGLQETMSAVSLIGTRAGSLAGLSVNGFGITPSVGTSLGAWEPLKIDSALGETISGVRRAMDDALAPYRRVGDSLRQMEEQQRDLRNTLLGALCGPVGEITRTAQWMGGISGDITGYGPRLGDSMRNAVEGMRSSMRGLEAPLTAHLARMSSVLGLGQAFSAEFESTRVKMSFLAGISEVSTPQSFLRGEAYQQLFGEWRVHPRLPRSFWYDVNERTRFYKDSDVDDGLIHASPGMALEIMIESGLATGMRSDDGAVAVVAVGDVSMTVRSRSPRHDAFTAVSVFEQELRTFVSRKMEERFGTYWFRDRASNLVGKAKAARKAALERGEEFLPLIEFTDLGELATLMQSKANWDDVFGDIFIHRDAFSLDMQRLIAVRRPAMHARPVDGVLLVEMLCVIRRLSVRIANDGAWKADSELDR
ncbi:Swt1 family HEPN domain-containing protein [Agrobacterium rubi]|uniref:Swt1 family HEPN domain-containing protein n=1 Tax=Agrobacterium rubi TaxID=28099 RepID=UPI00103B45F4|nr:Swt1 family HEPN domain-containing protein [Agrobacterium rubi]MBP1877633.1 hypothetical protein [Agrobacterium rubi]